MKEQQSAAETSAPTVSQLEAELKRVTYYRQYHHILRSTIFTLITVAAAAVLVAIPVFTGSAHLRFLHDSHAERRRYCDIHKKRRL